jgi:hypothetical protein
LRALLANAAAAARTLLPGGWFTSPDIRAAIEYEPGRPSFNALCSVKITIDMRCGKKERLDTNKRHFWAHPGWTSMPHGTSPH